MIRRRLAAIVVLGVVLLSASVSMAIDGAILGILPEDQSMVPTGDVDFTIWAEGYTEEGESASFKIDVVVSDGGGFPIYSGTDQAGGVNGLVAPLLEEFTLYDLEEGYYSIQVDLSYKTGIDWIPLESASSVFIIDEDAMP